jgi:hypothetical protein
MKMADLLHSIADMLDGQEEGGSPDRPENSGKSADDFQHDVQDGAESGDKEVELGAMMPPLQQKLEILKKATGMDNAFDDKGSNELDHIKKLSGIRAVVQHEAGEDNDITG